MFENGVPELPTWGSVASVPYLNQQNAQDKKKLLGGISKSTFMIEDAINLKALVLNNFNLTAGVNAATTSANVIPVSSGPTATAAVPVPVPATTSSTIPISGAAPAATGVGAGGVGGGAPIGATTNATTVALKKLRELVDDLPMLQRERNDAVSGSYGSHYGDMNDDDSLSGTGTGGAVSGATSFCGTSNARYIPGSSLYDDDDRMKLYEQKHAMHGGHGANQGSHHVLGSMENSSSVGEGYLNDFLRLSDSKPHHSSGGHRFSGSYSHPTMNLQATVEDLNERQSSMSSLIAATTGQNKESLLALMASHDKNIFRTKAFLSSQLAASNAAALAAAESAAALSRSVADMTASHNKASAAAVTAAAAATAAAASAVSRAAPSGMALAAAPGSVGDDGHSAAAAASAVTPLVTADTSATGAVGAVGASNTTTAGSIPNEVVKKAEPMTREQKMRAALISGSHTGANSSRLKQVQMLQQQQQLQQQQPVAHGYGDSVRTDSRALSLVAQQQMRAAQQQQQQLGAGGGGGGGGGGSHFDPSASSSSEPGAGGFEERHRSSSSSSTSGGLVLASGDDAGAGIGAAGSKALLTPTGKQGKGQAEDTSEHSKTESGTKGSSSSSSAAARASLLASSTKKYQKLTNKSFQSAKGLVVPSGNNSKPSSEALVRAKLANPYQQFAIYHGKIVPIHSTDNDAKMKAELYTKYIREYSQTHCVNPFRLRDTLRYTRSQSHNRRRWVHVYSQS
jgi:hypothetical protein